MTKNNLTRTRGHPLVFTKQAKQLYLDTMRQKGTVGESCAAAGVTRQTVFRHREKDPVFADAENRALEDYRELVIEREIRRRAIEGVDEPVFDKNGNKVGERTRYSDNLLILHAKRHIPAYRDSPPPINPAQINVFAFIQQNIIEQGGAAGMDLSTLPRGDAAEINEEEEGSVEELDGGESGSDEMAE